MAFTYFWVLGSGTYDGASTANWSLLSGGAAGAGPPTSADDVKFDANSGGGTVTFSSGVAKTFDSTGYTGTFDGGFPGVTVSGSITLGASIAGASAADFTIAATGTFTSNAKTINRFNVQTASITVTLGGNLTCGGTGTHSDGTIDLAGFTYAVPQYTSGGSVNARTLTFNGGILNCYGTTGNVFNQGSVGLTITAGAGTIKLTGGGASSITFVGGYTLPILWFARGAGTGTCIITGANIFSELKDDGTAAHQITFPASTTQTITTWTITGNSGALISIRSSSAGTQATLSKSAGTVNANYLDIQDSAATGGATWNAGANSVDSLNNTGWIFGSVPSIASWNENSWPLIPRVLRRFPTAYAAYFGPSVTPPTVPFVSAFDHESWQPVLAKIYPVSQQPSFFGPTISSTGSGLTFMDFPQLGMPWPLSARRNPMPEWTFQIGAVLNPAPVPPRPSATVFAMTESAYLVRVIQTSGY